MQWNNLDDCFLSVVAFVFSSIWKSPMKPERIVKFCEKNISAIFDNSPGNDFFGSYSDEMKTAMAFGYQHVIDFIMKSDQADASEVKQIKEIYQKNYSIHISKLTGSRKSAIYNFTTKIDRLIAKTLIPLIKEEIANNEWQMSVIDFFTFYMDNIPDWWRQKAFDITTLAKEENFRKICLDIITSKSASAYASAERKKATVQDVMGDLNLSPLNNEDNE